VSAQSPRADGIDAGLVPQGRIVFREGLSPSGARISARVGLGGALLSGAAIACGNCHGLDGRGRPEGGVVPPDIRWSTLTREDGHRHEGGRRHGPFDTATLARAVTEGLDPAGQALDLTMPRYALSAHDLEALATYLRVLEHERDPGIAPTVLRIAGLLPAVSGETEGHGAARAGEAPAGPLAQALRQVIEASIAAVNRRGGVHGRRIEWVEVRPGAGANGPAWTAEDLERELRRADVLALVAPFAVGHEAAVKAVAERLQLPVLGPLTLQAEGAEGSSPWVFHTLAGVPDLALALAREVQRRAPAASERAGAGARVAGPADRPWSALLWHPADEAGLALAQSVADRLRGEGWAPVLMQAFTPQAAQGRGAPAALPHPRAPAPLALAESATAAPPGVPDAVFVLGAGADLRAVWAAAAGSAAPDAPLPQATAPAQEGTGAKLPWLLLPGTLASREVLDLTAAQAQRVLLAYPQLLQRQAAAARQGLAELQAGERSAADQPLLVATRVALLLLIEGLERSGRELSRQGLTGTLERLQGFDTGLVPPLSFGPGRRVGAAGGYVVEVDAGRRSLRAVGGFAPAR
jgi:ABC-type branched-subunit amino acid transport system substrate-binding protein